MAGISSKAAGKLENKKQYAGNELQSKEFADGSGLDFYDFNARSYDHQIGRFHQIDPMTDEGGQESLTPFQYCGNNPVLYSDPDGKIFFVLPIVYYAVAAGVAAGVTYVAVKHPINVTGAVANVKTAINETHAKNAAAGDVGIVTGSPLGLTTGTTYRKLNAEGADAKPKGAANDKVNKSREVGQEAHRQEQAEIKKQDPGADIEKTIQLKDGTVVRKDAILSDGTAVIIKPNTTSGQSSAQRRGKLLSDNGENKWDIRYYNPNDPKYQPGSPTYIGPKKPGG
jgi:RHS repeat-associated protein